MMFGKQNQPALAREGELLAMSEQAREAFYQQVEPSVAAKLSPQALFRQVSDALHTIAAQKLLPYNATELARLTQQMVDEMIGIGPIQPLLDDPSVSDILVNGPHSVYVERNGKLERTRIRFHDKQHVLNVAQRIVNAVGRRVDESTPMVDARLADGSRVNVIAPPLALHGTTISIRKFPAGRLTLDALVSHQSLSPEMARFLALAAEGRFNMLVSGGTGSGKTTLLNALSQHISEDERILTIEDAAELSLDQPHWVPLETRNESAEGKGEVTIRQLVRNALRMRPDRIILGEVRGSEAFDMLQAMNTGHDGSLCTLHANNPQDAMIRLSNMLQMGAEKLSESIIQSQIVSAVDLVVQLERMRDGKRRITAISEVADVQQGRILMKPIFRFRYQKVDRTGIEGVFEPCGISEALLEKAAQAGLDQALQACCQPSAAAEVAGE
ncbi:CpaF family protein [Photobacterium sp. 1_MG-2023]|uniref:CpaF family protein n=1 Tax=Photobacterium sp. 1_MG-2023 TaxID=3062646 RepID=UPI0026E2BAD6|nr:CpaF family protein [Photobacterium sp. 1_MG-2023]MDO6708217.1 CpaF family protein [Photobacterium sp. 1_MG-2023]